MRAHKDGGEGLAAQLVGNMRVAHWVPKAKRHAFEFQEGLVEPMHIVHAPVVRNAVSAVGTRVLKYQQGDGSLVDLPTPVPGEVERLGCMMRKMTASAGSHQPYSLETLVALQTTARKRARMVRAGCSLGMYPLCRRDAEVKAFVKRECLKAGKPCRLIQPRDDRYLCEAARHLKPMEKSLYKALDVAVGYKAVMKGLNGVERAAELRRAWDSFSDPCAVSLDFKKYDQHVRGPVLGEEHSVYVAHTTAPDYLKTLLGWQLVNRGRVLCCDGLVKYVSSGGRMSGDPNTSLGNILICLCGHIMYSQDVGVGVRVLNDGDDSVIIMEKTVVPRFLANLEDWWLKLGFRIGVDSVTQTFERIDFCQCRPVCVNGLWTMIRNPATAIQKDLTSGASFCTETERKAWLAAVGEGGLSQYGGVPLYDALYRRLKNAGKRSKTSYQWVAELRRSQHYRKTGIPMAKGIAPSTRVSFYVAFGITPDQQKLFEGAARRHIFTTSAPGHSVTLDRLAPIPRTVLLKGTDG